MKLAKHKNYEMILQMFDLYKSKVQNIDEKLLGYALTSTFMVCPDRFMEFYDITKQQKMKPSTLLYGFLCKHYVLSRQVEKVFETIAQMQADNMELDRNCYYSLLRASVVTGDSKKIASTLAEMKDKSIDINEKTLSFIIKFYAKLNDINSINKMYNIFPFNGKRNFNIMKSIVGVLYRTEDYENSTFYFKEFLQNESFDQTSVIFDRFIQIFATKNDEALINKALQMMHDNEMKISFDALQSLFYMYLRLNTDQQAVVVLNTMRQLGYDNPPKMINHLIQYYTKAGDTTKASIWQSKL